MKLPGPFLRGTLIRRYKRFLADVRLDDGTVVTALCPNTGRMTSCSEPGRPVLLSDSGNALRKHPLTLEMIRMGRTWVGINTARPNGAVAHFARKGRIPELAGYREIRRCRSTSPRFETPGARSRVIVRHERSDHAMSAEPFTVLVVDDNEFVRATLARHLGEEGYEVLEATDGQAALDAVVKKSVSLVLLDIAMPGMGGLEVLGQLRQLYPPTVLPVIIASASKSSDEMIQAFDLGASDFVTKPLDLPVVLARVQSQLRSRFPDRARALFDGIEEVQPFGEVRTGALVDGRYRLESAIGEGQHGSVYRATHLKLQRPVAIKLLRTGALADQNLIDRFEREGISACRVEHPNAVSVLDFSVTKNGVSFLVMELLQGHSLDAELKRGALVPKRCAQILLPVCEVLMAAHATGVIHRDIKPQNVFLHHTRQGKEVVKVLDFGIAKLVDEAQHSLTQDGRGPGTPAYMAPERFADRSYDGRADVYSVGIMLYLMLTGELPFTTTGNPIKLAIMHLNDLPRPPRQLRPEITDELEDMVLRALEKDPLRRPTAEVLGRSLAAATGRHWSPKVRPAEELP